LVYETSERLPLIKVFDHPWVKNFEKKYNLSKQPSTKANKGKQKTKKEKKPEPIVVQPQASDKTDASKANDQPNSNRSAAESANDSKLMKKQNSTPKTTAGDKEKDLSNDDIIKEIEEYVNDKKKTTGKYLDDISEFDASKSPAPFKGKLNKNESKHQN
jgi:hypothetical protein